MEKLGRRLFNSVYRFKYQGFLDDFRKETLLRNQDGLYIDQFDVRFDEPEYQKQRVYSDEIPLADLTQPRWRRAIEDGYDGIFLFETNNSKL